MLRRLAVLLLVSLLPWQSLAWAVDAAGGSHVHDTSHVLAHWVGAPHHHHDDGSLHADDSEESLRHLQADAPLNSAVLVPGSLMWVFGALPSNGPPETGLPLRPAPFLEGLRRPPRTLRC